MSNDFVAARGMRAHQHHKRFVNRPQRLDLTKFTGGRPGYGQIAFVRPFQFRIVGTHASPLRLRTEAMPDG
jgi:hypothetical protein